MKTDLAVAVAAPLEYRLNGTVLLFSPLNVRDFAEFDRWMRAQIIQVNMDVIRANPDLTEDEQLLLLHQANITGARMSITDPKSCNGLNESPEGVLRFLWLSARHKTPGITEDRISELIGADGAEMGRMSMAVMGLSYPSEEELEESDGAADSSGGDKKEAPAGA